MLTPGDSPNTPVHFAGDKYTTYVLADRQTDRHTETYLPSIAANVETILSLKPLPLQQ